MRRYSLQQKAVHGAYGTRVCWVLSWTSPGVPTTFTLACLGRPGSWVSRLVQLLAVLNHRLRRATDLAIPICNVRVCVQVAYHASRALLQYIRAHLLIHLTALQRRLRDGPVRGNNKTALLLNLCVLPQLAAAHTGLHACTHARPAPHPTHTAGPAPHTSDRTYVTPATVERLCWRADAAVLCCAVCLTVPAGPICCPAASQAHQHQCSSGGGTDCGCVDRRETGRGLHAHPVGFTTIKHVP